MEIAPVPHRASRGERRRLALGLLIVTPVVLLLLVPTTLGLERYVVTDTGMEGSLGRGSLVLARDVPPTDLRPGDVITFRPPGGAPGERVTRRIQSIDGAVVTTRADATGTADPWTVRLSAASYSRVALGVPWIGYPFVLDGGWLLLAGVAALALGLALASGRRTSARVVPPARAELPVG